MKLEDELLDMLKCDACNSDHLVQVNSMIECQKCGSRRKVWKDIIIRNSALEMSESDNEHAGTRQSYEKETKHRYQSDDYAQHYFKQYKQWYKPKNIYSAWMAYKEKSIVADLLSMIDKEIDTLLDLPAGSGKLSEIHQQFDYNIIPADVSFEMLKAGLNEWERNRKMMGMVQMDATNINLKSNSMDAVVCLRLMHRLNLDLNREILGEFKRIAKKYIITSYSVNNLNIADLLSLKNRKHKKSSSRMDYSAKEWESLLNEFGTVVESTFISRGISRGVISLVDIN